MENIRGGLFTQPHFQDILRSYFQLKSIPVTYIYFKLIYFIFGCVGSSLLHGGFLWLRRAGASHCGGFSRCRTWALGTWASVVVARGLGSCGSRALERKFSSRGAQA